MKGLVFDTENRMQFKDFGEPLLGNHHTEHRCQQDRGGDFLKVRGKKLTRRQKEALSAQGWDFRLYLCVRDAPDFMELVNRTTGKYVMFRK